MSDVKKKIENLFPTLTFDYTLLNDFDLFDSLQNTIAATLLERNGGTPNFYVGTDFDDELDGGGADDLIVGGAGNDFIRGQGGRDVLQGGAGADTVLGQGGDDFLIYNFSENLDGLSDYYDGGGDTQGPEDSIWFMLTYGEYLAYGEEIEQYQSALIDNTKAHGFYNEFSFNNLIVDDIESAEIIRTNRGPTAYADAFTTDEDTPYTTADVRLNDTDPDNLDQLSVIDLDVTGTVGAITEDFSTGQFLYDPNYQFEYLAVGESTTDSFAYTIRDLAGVESTATVTMTINGVNDRPVAGDIAVNVHEDDLVGVSGSFLVSDLDLTDTHTFEIVSGPAGGSVANNNDGTFTFTPDDDYQFLLEGQDRDVTFTYQAIDDSGSVNNTSEEKTVTVTVNGAYDAPILLTDDLLFITENQSMWASGPALVLEPELPFLGLSWTRGQTEETLTIVESRTYSGAALDALADAAGWVANAAQDAWDWVTGSDSDDIEVPSSITTPEVSVSGWTSGKVGLQPYFSMTSGDVDSSLPVEISFLVPKQAEQGQTITIETGYSLDGGATFNTASPNASMGLDLVFQFDAGASAKIGSTNYTIFSMPAINETFNLIDFSAEDIELSLDFEGPASGADLGNFTVGVPVINTTGTPDPIGSDTTLTSSGEDSIMSLTLDLDGYLSEAVALATGVPLPLEKSWGESIEGFGIEIIGASAEFNIFDIELTGDLKAVQNFSLEIDELPLLILLEDGSQLTNYKAGDSITFDVPTFDVDTQGDADGWLDFDVTIDMDAIFDNLTSLGFDLTLAMEALSASIGITSDLFTLPSLDFGPVWEDEFELFSTDNFATLFEDDFSLLGFNQDYTSQQLDVSIIPI